MAACYLDWNASAPLWPEVREAVVQCLSSTGNPSSVHQFGRAQRRLVEDARAAVLELVGLGSPLHQTGAARPPRAASSFAPDSDVAPNIAPESTPLGLPAPQVIFTSGATEAASLALYGLRPKQDGTFRPGDSVALIGATEHPCLHQAAATWWGTAVETCPVQASGLIDLDWLRARLSPAARAAGAPPVSLVAVQAANNETGVLQPIAELASLAHDAGAFFLCDAVQAVGKIPFSARALGVDALLLSAHKLGGLAGCGALVLCPSLPAPTLAAGGWLPLAPLTAGGGQERGLRGGTQNTVGIHAFGVAARRAQTALVASPPPSDWRPQLESLMRAAVPSVRIYGEDAPRLPNTICFAVAGKDQQGLMMRLDLSGFALSAGSACSSGKVAPSPVLLAMGEAPERAREALRLSFGPLTPWQDLTACVQAWAQAVS